MATCLKNFFTLLDKQIMGLRYLLASTYHYLYRFRRLAVHVQVRQVESIRRMHMRIIQQDTGDFGNNRLTTLLSLDLMPLQTAYANYMYFVPLLESTHRKQMNFTGANFMHPVIILERVMSRDQIAAGQTSSTIPS